MPLSEGRSDVALEVLAQLALRRRCSHDGRDAQPRPRCSDDGRETQPWARRSLGRDTQPRARYAALGEILGRDTQPGVVRRARYAATLA